MESAEDLRQLLIGLMVGLTTIGIVNSLWFGWHLREYVYSTPRIETYRDLDRFKGIVSTQMYVTLAQLAFLILPYAVLALGFFWFKVLDKSDVVYLLVPSVIFVAVGLYFKRIEDKATELPVAGEFRDEFRQVVKSWTEDRLPNW